MTPTWVSPCGRATLEIGLTNCQARIQQGHSDTQFAFQLWMTPAACYYEVG